MEQSALNGFSSAAREHARHPRRLGPLRDFDAHAQKIGETGETMEFWLVVRDGRVSDVSFETDGTAACYACGSMAATLVADQSLAEAGALESRDILDALGGLPPEQEHHAFLAVSAFKDACADYAKRRREAADKGGCSKTACDACSDQGCSASARRNGESDEDYADRRKLQSRLCHIRSKIAVFSGKGGVGKSTVAVNLATALALSGKRVGLLDIDIHGPSIPTMLGLEGRTIEGGEDGLQPIEVDGMKVMSLGFLLQNPDEAVVWRGPMKTGVIKQFLADVAWGDLDFLIIDSPPGTGDEPLSICQLAGGLDGAVIVTTPQKVAAVDVRKSISFCRHLQVPVLGVIENMSGFVCPKCGELTKILRSGGGRRIAEDMGTSYLGAIPLDPSIAESGDVGRAFLQHYASTATAGIMRDIVRPIVAMQDKNTK
jgi:ATP-binding protein involved in chromosome partitioning